MAHHEPFKPLSKVDVAELLRVTPRTIESWVEHGLLPGPACIGNRVFWHPDLFYSWLDQRLRLAKADAQAALDGEPAAPVQRSNIRASAEVAALRARDDRRLQALQGQPA